MSFFISTACIWVFSFALCRADWYPIHQHVDINNSSRLQCLDALLPDAKYGTCYDKFVKESYQEIARTTLELRSGAIIFHGTTGAGKSSLIERLLMREFKSIHTPTAHQSKPDLNGTIIGDTKTAKAYRFEIASENTLYVIDTPGCGEHSTNGQEMVLEGFANALGLLQELDVPLIGLYFIIDGGATRSALWINSNLTLFRNMYGHDAAKRIRIILNKVENIATYGRDHIIENYIQVIDGCFQETFGSACDKILFTCADFYSPNICFGQLLNDLCIGTQDDFNARVVTISEECRAHFFKEKREFDARNSQLSLLLSSSETSRSEIRALIESEESSKNSLEMSLPSRQNAIDNLNIRLRSRQDSHQAIRGRRPENGGLNLEGCFEEMDTAAIIEELRRRCSNLNRQEGSQSTLLAMVDQIERNFAQLHPGSRLPVGRRLDVQNVIVAAMFAMDLIKMYRQDQSDIEHLQRLDDDIRSLNDRIVTSTNELRQMNSDIFTARDKINEWKREEAKILEYEDQLRQEQSQIQNKLANIRQMIYCDRPLV